VAYRIAAIPVTSNDSHGQLPITSLFDSIVSYSCAAVEKFQLGYCVARSLCNSWAFCRIQKTPIRVFSASS